MALDLTETTLEHRGHRYLLAGGPPDWAITRDGTLVGHLVVQRALDPGDDPIYMTRTADGQDGGLEGSDWEQLVKGLLNEFDPAIADPTSDVPGAGG